MKAWSASSPAGSGKQCRHARLHAPGADALQALRHQPAVVGVEPHDVGHGAQRHQVEQFAGPSRARVVSADLGFAVGPRINAAGRLDDIGLGIRCLLEDEPALWRRDYTGAIEQWIELGQPDEARLRKASGRAQQVVVVSYGGQAAEAWWKRNAAALTRLRNLSVIELDDAGVAEASALLERGMRVTAMIQDGELQLMDAERSVSLRPRMRMLEGVATPD